MGSWIEENIISNYAWGGKGAAILCCAGWGGNKRGRGLIRMNGAKDEDGPELALARHPAAACRPECVSSFYAPSEAEDSECVGLHSRASSIRQQSVVAASCVGSTGRRPKFRTIISIPQ